MKSRSLVIILMFVAVLVFVPTSSAFAQSAAKITDLSATAGVGEITLSWTVPDLNGGTFRNYDILYGDVIETVSDYSTNSKTITVSENVPYTFTIRTETSAGSSLPSNEATATPYLSYSITTDDGYVVSFYESESKYHVSIDGANNDTLENLAINHSTTMSVVQDGQTAYVNDYERPTRSYSVPVTNCTLETLDPATDCTLELLNPDKSFVTSRNGYPGFDPTKPFTVHYDMTPVSNDFQNVASVVTFPTPTLPSQITDLAATARDGAVELTWTASNLNGGTFAHYTITYGDETVNITPYSTTSTTISNLNNGEEYTFTIITHRSAGSSSQSNAVTATPVGLSSQITDLAASSGDGKVDLTWTAPELNGGTFENYTITYGGETAKITSHSTTSTTISNLNNGEEYTFTIRTETSAGSSLPSNEATATPYLSYSITTDDGYVVSFYESESKYHIGINGATEDTRTNLAIANNYFISVNQDGHGVYQNTYEQLADSCDVSLIECGSELRNPDKSFITSGNGYPGFEPTRPFTVKITITPSEFFSSDGLQRVKALVTFPTPTLPSQITDLAATAGDGAVELTWTAPELNGGTFENYTITYGDKTTLLTTPHSTTSTTISNLNNGEEYTFTIITHRSAGSSLPSNAVTVTLPVPVTPIANPSTILDLRAVADVGEITLTWTAPDLNGGTFVSYYIYDSGGDIIETISDHSTTSKTFAFPNVAPQSFSIRTETSSGLGSRSNTVTATPLAPVQSITASQITDLAATAGDGAVELTWTAPELNGGTFENYTITYGGETAKITSHSTTSKTITIPNDAPYTFEIKTSTSAGSSAQSNAVTVTSLAPDVYTFTAIQSANGEVIEFQLAVTKSNEEDSESFSLRSGYTSTIFLIQDDEVKYTEDYQVSNVSASCKRFDRGCPLGPYFTIDKDDSNIDHLQDLTIKIEIDKVNNSATGVVYTAQRDSAFLLDNIFPELKPAPPSQITDFTATAGHKQVTLDWDEPDLNNNGNVVTYTITYNDNNGVEQIETVDAPTTEKLITNLANGHSYTFSITATNNIPLTSAPTTVTITTLTGTPSQPTNLQAIRNGGVVNITWEVPTDDGGSDITGYHLPHPTGGAVEVRKTSFKYFFTLSADNTYDIVVIARNVNGLGAPATVTVNALVELPSQITDFSATPLDGGVDLFWTALDLNGGTFEKYELTYGDQTKTFGTHSTSSTRVSDLNNGEEYTFTITATTDLGTSTPSTVTATPAGLASTITDLTVTAGDKTVTLTWTAPNLNGGTFENYTITYGGETARITPHSTTSTTISNLNNGEEYTFTIRTETSAGLSLQSNPITATPTATATPSVVASQITDLKAVAGDGEVTLTWTAPNLNGGTFSHYQVLYFDGDEGVVINGYSTTSKTFTFSNVVSQTFTIRTITSAGISLESDAVTPTPLAPQLPSPITDLSATVDDGTVTLTWTAPNLNGGTFENYEISDGGVSENIKLFEYSGNSRTFTGLSVSRDHVFTVVTNTSSGTSLASNTVTVPSTSPVTPIAPQLPSQITDLRATAGVGTITLTWTAPNLNGGTFVEYDIFYEGGDANETITDHSTTSRTLTFSNVVPQTFTIVTRSSVGVSSQSNMVTVTPLAPVQSITASQITDLAVTAVGDGQVDLTWSLPDNNGEFFAFIITYGDTTVTINTYDAQTTTISNLNNGEEYTFTINTHTAEGFSIQSNAVTATPSVPINTFVEVGNDVYKLTFGPPSTTGETTSITLAVIDSAERSSLQAGYTASMFLTQDNGETKYTKDATYGEKRPCAPNNRSCNTGPAFLINNVNSNVNPSQDLTIKIVITKAGDIGNDVVYTAIVLSSYLIENSVFSTPDSTETKKKSGGGSSDWKKKPTFGKSWEISSAQLVEDGFSFNGHTVDIDDNWHTDFIKTSSIIGDTNTVKIKTYAADGLKSVHLLLGLPEIGNSQADSEISVLLERNYNNPNDYDITEITHTQPELLVDPESTTASITPSLCNASHTEPFCHTITINFTVMAPLMDDVVGIQAIDTKRRSTITYINEGVEFTGDSLLNPATHSFTVKKSSQSASETIELTQQDRRYQIWQDQDGYLWTQNNYGTWSQITKADYVTPEDDHSMTVKTRVHSDFAKLVEYENNRAILYWDSSEIQNELGETFAYDFSNIDYDSFKLEKLSSELQIEQGKAQAIINLMLD